MAFFEQLRKRITEAGQGAAQQDKNFADVTRLNSAISDKEKKIAQLYQNIGQVYYERHGSDPAPEHQQAVEEIKGLFAEIAQNQEEIKQIKGIVKCPNCGADVPLQAAFCNACGTKMPQPTPPAAPAPAGDMQTCPSCGERVTRVEGEAATRCTNPQCPAQLLRNLIHFASRDAMDIDGLGPAILEQLLDQELIASPADLYTLQAAQLQKLERFGKKSAQNLVASIERSKSNDLSRLVYALGIPHIGAKAAQTLCAAVPTMEGLEQATEEELSQIEGFGGIMAKEVAAFFQKESAKGLVERLRELGVNMEAQRQETQSSALEGSTFVLTGTLPTMSRKEATQLIESHGGKVTSSVSKKTSYVLAGEEAGSKLEKARQLEIPVLTEEDLRNMLKDEGTEGM